MLVEADDPEGAKGSLLGATIPSSIDSGLDDGFFCLGEKLFSSPSEALGFLKNIVVALFSHDATLDSGHKIVCLLWINKQKFFLCGTEMSG